MKERTNTKLHFVEVSVEKIKYRAQVHQDTPKVSLYDGRGRKKKRSFLLILIKLVHLKLRMVLLTFLQLT